MTVKSMTLAALGALMLLSGCASTGGNNTTYANYQGSYPQPFLGEGSGASVGIPLQ